MSGAQIVSRRRINQLRLPFAEGLWQVVDLYVTGQGKSKLNGSYMSMFAAEGKESGESHDADSGSCGHP